MPEDAEMTRTPPPPHAAREKVLWGSEEIGQITRVFRKFCLFVLVQTHFSFLCIRFRKLPVEPCQGDVRPGNTEGDGGG